MTDGQVGPSTDRCGGFALVSVLLFLMVVAAVITPFVLAARTDFLVTSNAYRKSKQTQLAAGLADFTARQVASLEQLRSETLLLNSEPMRSVCGKHSIEIRVQDQLGLINANLAPIELLQAGFATLAPPDANPRDLAELALAYRDPEGKSQGADEKQLSDGFKFLPFEAIEELYEFSGFQGMPVSILSRVFTVHGGIPAVRLDNAPKLLADSIKGKGLDRDPFVDTGTELSRFYRIEVTVRSSADQSTGFAGFQIEIGDGTDGKFKKTERTVVPGIISSAPQNFAANLECEQLLGDDLAKWMAAQ